MALFMRRPKSAVIRLMAAARLPSGGGEISVRDIAMEAIHRDSGRIAACLQVVEELLAEEGDATHAALQFLEALQNAASHGSADLLTIDELLPLLGPRTVVGWETADRFWQSVVAWCDENGVELESSEQLRGVQNQRLRSIMWPSCWSLPDGRRVGLSDVVRYENAGGMPMA